MKASGHCFTGCQAGFGGQELLRWTWLPKNPSSHLEDLLGLLPLHIHTVENIWKVFFHLKEEQVFINGNVSSFPLSMCNLVCACLFMGLLTVLALNHISCEPSKNLIFYFSSFWIPKKSAVLTSVPGTLLLQVWSLLLLECIVCAYWGCSHLDVVFLYLSRQIISKQVVSSWNLRLTL